VEETTVDSFIPTQRALQIAATISQVSGLMMTGATATEMENVQRVKETVMMTVTVPLDFTVEQTTVKSFIPTL